MNGRRWKKQHVQITQYGSYIVVTDGVTIAVRAYIRPVSKINDRGKWLGVIFEKSWDVLT